MSEQFSSHASVFANAVSQANNQLIVSQSFNNLESFHETPPIDKTSITRLFSSSDVAPYAANARDLVREIKKPKNASTKAIPSKQRRLLLRAAAARERAPKTCQAQSRKIDNRSQQRN
ncbi:MAG TPA: hypothetical protein VFG30_16620 [Polyangiales bacterium]|nr:hypothetical protein [Polyangiales bacterium]